MGKKQELKEATSRGEAMRWPLLLGERDIVASSDAVSELDEKASPAKEHFVGEAKGLSGRLCSSL